MSVLSARLASVPARADMPSLALPRVFKTLSKVLTSPSVKVLAFVAVAALALMMGTQSHALDLVNFTGILATGALASLLTQLAGLVPAIKAVVVVLAAIIAFISLASLRQAGAALFFVLVVVFAGSALTIAGTILGFVA